MQNSKRTWHLWVCLWLLVVAHMIIVVGFVSSFFVLPFMEPWYVALPLMAFIQYFCLNTLPCKLTELENYLRGRLGIRKIRGFVGHYLVKPIKERFT